MRHGRRRGRGIADAETVFDRLRFFTGHHRLTDAARGLVRLLLTPGPIAADRPRVLEFSSLIPAHIVRVLRLLTFVLQPRLQAQPLVAGETVRRDGRLAQVDELAAD